MLRGGHHTKPLPDATDKSHGNFQHKYTPDLDAATHMWQSVALPKFLQVLATGAGHAMYHDVQWSTRHGRIANVLQQFGGGGESHGPHLILTTQPDVQLFAQQFRKRSWWDPDDDDDSPALSVLPYVGSPQERKVLRKNFTHASGLPSSAFHVAVASYTHFF